MYFTLLLELLIVTLYDNLKCLLVPLLSTIKISHFIRIFVCLKYSTSKGRCIKTLKNAWPDIRYSLVRFVLHDYKRPYPPGPPQTEGLVCDLFQLNEKSHI